MTSAPKKTLCLNMIVKNESHIISQNLEKLTQKLSFDYWVISDTGSTDNTVALIIEFFKNKGIPGEIHQDDWKGFGHNRTVALAHAFGKTDYLLIFDADDEIVGNLNLTLSNLTLDSYRLVFGNAHTFSYERPLIVNNHKKWKFVGVLHEYLDTLVQGDSHTTAVIIGDYSVVSGRTGNRSSDPDKYYKDALVLEKAYAEEVQSDGKLVDRYCFYCANSYFDCGRFEDAAIWYKKALTHKGWDQEKYISCLKLYKCYKRMKAIDTSHFYLVKSFYYDKERVECIYKLVLHFACEGQHQIAFSYYSLIQHHYETKYINSDYTSKLFVDNRVANFFLPYYMIIVADGVKNFNLGVKMFEIIFIKKTEGISHWHIGNIMHNLRIFIGHVSAIDKIAPGYSANFFKLCNAYFMFLQERGYNFDQHDYMNTLAVYDIPCLKRFLVPIRTFTDEECTNSLNVLFFAGFGGAPWNYTQGITDALGGSERAVAFLTYYLPLKYNIFIAGDVKEETFRNVTYINMQNVGKLIASNCFYTVVISRYISFFELFPHYRAHQTFLWTHDTTYHNYGCSLDCPTILSKHDAKITGVVCLTDWHKKHIATLFPVLTNKIHIINNGITPNLFPVNRTHDQPIKKIKNQFIYSSCSERGLKRLLELWPDILLMAPDATLRISSYNRFPRDKEETQMWETIKKHDSITHLGKLNPAQLYGLMASSEYWLYTSYWPETSCITALEMLQSGVICLYYPCAGIAETMGGCGFQIKESEELGVLKQILNLSKEEKDIIMIKGKEYSDRCSWENRASTWVSLCFNQFKELTLNPIETRMLYLSEVYCMPPNHVSFLEKLSEAFTPKVIYDIGANVMHWVQSAKNNWPNAHYVAFDAIQDCEFLYKLYGVEYHIGVLSDQDNKPVRFYANDENPAGNSCYIEIGSINSSKFFQKNAYKEHNAMTLTTVVNMNQFLKPDLVKIDVQGGELDILKGSMDTINCAKYLIVELQHVNYNEGAPLADETISFLKDNGWDMFAPMFSNNGPDADYCFVNTNYKEQTNESLLIKKT